MLSCSMRILAIWFRDTDSVQYRVHVARSDFTTSPPTIDCATDREVEILSGGGDPAAHCLYLCKEGISGWSKAIHKTLPF